MKKRSSDQSNNDKRSDHHLHEREPDVEMLFSDFEDASPIDDFKTLPQSRQTGRPHSVERAQSCQPGRSRRGPVERSQPRPKSGGGSSVDSVAVGHDSRSADQVSRGKQDERLRRQPPKRRPQGERPRQSGAMETDRRRANAQPVRSQAIRSRRRRRPKLSVADKIIRALSAFLIFVLLISIAVFAVWRYVIGEAKTGVTDTTVIVTNEVGETLSTAAPEPVKVRDGQIINILLMGMDLQGVGEEHSRSDTMMLATIDQKRNVVKLTSFQRDMLVYLPGTDTPVKLNSASQAGPFRLIETLNNTFHLDIKDYIKFDIRGAEDIIDAVGGVDVVLSEEPEVLEYLRRLITEQNAVYEGWDDRTNWVDNIWEGGAVHLNGRQAIAYSRMRELDSDFARMERQQEIMTKVYDKVKNSSAGTLLSLLRVALSHVETNLTDTELTQMGLTLLPKLSNKIQQNTVPIDGYFWMDNYDEWVIRANFNEIIPILHRFIYEEELGEFTSVRLVPYTPLTYTEEENMPVAIRQGWYVGTPHSGPNGLAGGTLLDSTRMPTATQPIDPGMGQIVQGGTGATTNGSDFNAQTPQQLTTTAQVPVGGGTAATSPGPPTGDSPATGSTAFTQPLTTAPPPTTNPTTTPPPITSETSSASSQLTFPVPPRD